MTTSTSANTVSSATRGRPRSLVDREHLTLLRSLRCTWPDISSITGVSVKTLQRREKQWGILTYSSISNHDLKDAIDRLLHAFPLSGEVMLRGHLHSLGICMCSKETSSGYST